MKDRKAVPRSSESDHGKVECELPCCLYCTTLIKDRRPGLQWCPKCGSALLLEVMGRGLRIYAVDNSCGRHLEEAILPDLEGIEAEVVPRGRANARPGPTGITLDETVRWLVEWDLNSYYERDDLDEGAEDT